MTETTGERPAKPRIAPVDLAELTDAQRSVAGIGASSVVQTLVRRPDLFTPWSALGGVLLSGGRLSVRDRELVILRVALRTRCEYEWANHVLAALAAGVSREELTGLSENDAPMLRAVDELCADNFISEDTWNALGLDDESSIELLIVAGFYLMNAGMLNSLGVQKESGRVGLGELPAPRASAAERPEGPAHGSPFGSWDVVFHHPVDDQRLCIELSGDNGELSGTVTSADADTTLPILSGQVNGSELSYTTRMTTPIEIELSWTAEVYGDRIFGEISMSGATFPFEGDRA